MPTVGASFSLKWPSTYWLSKHVLWERKEKIDSRFVSLNALLCLRLNRRWPEIWNPNHFPSSVDACRFMFDILMSLASNASWTIQVSHACGFIYVWSTYDVQTCKNKKERQNYSYTAVFFLFFSPPLSDSFVVLSSELRAHVSADFSFISCRWWSKVKSIAITRRYSPERG